MDGHFTCEASIGQTQQINLLTFDRTSKYLLAKNDPYSHKRPT